MARQEQQFRFEVAGDGGGHQLRHGDRREKLVKYIFGAFSVRRGICFPLPIIQFVLLEALPKLGECEPGWRGRLLFR